MLMESTTNKTSWDEFWNEFWNYPCDTAVERLVVLAVVSMQDECGVSHLSRKQLAAMSKVTLPYLSVVLKKLVQRGSVQIVTDRPRGY